MRLLLLAVLLALTSPLVSQSTSITVSLSNEANVIPVDFKVGNVTCSGNCDKAFIDHKGRYYEIEGGFKNGILSYLNERYDFNDSQIYRMHINAYQIAPSGYKKWRSWLDVSFYDQDRIEVFRIASWEDLESMPKEDRTATLIKTILDECMVLFSSYLRSQNLNSADSIGFFFDHEEMLSKDPLFTDEVTVKSLEDGKVGTGMYSITFANDSTYTKSLGGLVFGYTDGKDVYFSTRNYQNTTAFSKVVRQGKDWAIFYHDKVPTDEALVAGSIAAGVLLGVLTGIAVVPYFSNYEGHVVIDFQKNEIQPATFQYLKMRLKMNKELDAEAKKVGYKQVKSNILDWWVKVMESR